MLARVLRSAAAAPARRQAMLLSAQRGFASYPPHDVVGLPALSPTMEQGNIASWLLKEGDKASAGDVICQIETDKAVVDYEAQDDVYLAKILVPAGTEGIVVGQPIMVTCEEEDQLEGLKDFKLDETTAAVPPPEPKAPEEIPPKKEEVAVDPKSNEPSQTTQKNTKGTTATPTPAPAKPASATPAPAKPATAASTASPFAEKWGQGFKKSPISFSLAKKQQAYLDLYGLTGTTPVSKN